MEVNMAVFVMAIGILGMVALFPLGLRESTQGQADLKQSMFADSVLNFLVAEASQTNVTWTEWLKTPRFDPPDQEWPNKKLIQPNVPFASRPGFINASKLNQLVSKWELKDSQYKIVCCLVPGASDRVMGIMVQSTDLENVTEYNLYSNNPIYYAEALFQGVPNQ